MATEITARRQETSMLSKQQTVSHESNIRKLLTILAERRQAQVTPGTLLTFSKDLAVYSLSDIDQALMRIASVPRREGETAFPEVATILEAVRGVIRARKVPEPTSGERWAAHVDEYWKNPPAPLDAELQAKVDAMNEKFSLTKPKEIITVNAEIVCPRCQFAQAVSANFRNWTADEILEYGAVVKELEQIAERNRNMPDLPLGDVVEEVSK
jgi:hypothetical protein